jgi:hypothetical protein
MTAALILAVPLALAGIDAWLKRGDDRRGQR